MRKASSPGDQSPKAPNQVTPIFQQPLIEVVNDRPVLIIPTTPLTWSKSSVKKVQYNSSVSDWMSYHLAFKNWIRSCVMLHADNNLTETVCRLPDQFDEIGVQIIIETDPTGTIRVNN